MYRAWEEQLLVAYLEFDADLTMVAVARLFVARTMAEWELESLIDDARLVTSELVANAVLHSRTSIRLTLRSDGLDFVRIEVFDENTRVPMYCPPPPDATSGRGLSLVAAAASRWGTERHPHGKTVWAEIGVRPGDVEVDLTAEQARQDGTSGGSPAARLSYGARGDFAPA